MAIFLTPRLRAVADEIAKLGCQDIVYDIGADHAYLAIHLVQSGLCAAVAATDISRPSLGRARRNAERHGVSGNIIFYAGDGFSAIPAYAPGKAVVIAGIGGKNLINIIDGGIEKARAASLLLLQPMSGQEDLRGWLFGNAFEIMYERLALEGGRVYNVLACRRADAPVPYAPEELYLGKRVLYVSDDEYRQFLRFTRLKVANRYGGLKAAGLIGDNIHSCGNIYMEAALLKNVLECIDERLQLLCDGKGNGEKA
ncbi:MAG: class I SAM-dependent methyltransferase [Oscillospiraceae bacterium]|nr:class I SAM-dependent methyltransferase [Oscillospiraceae bacterium]